jgi:sulfate transport system ATP-binding protein
LVAPLVGAGLAGEVRAVAARGPDTRVECLIEGQFFELEARGPGIPSGVAPGLSLRIKPLRPKIYPAS